MEKEQIESLIFKMLRDWESKRNPAPQTINFFTSMEKELSDLKISFIEVKKDVEFIKEAEKRTEIMLNSFCDKADNIYARKQRVELLENGYKELREEQHKIMWKAISITAGIVGSLFGVIMFLIQHFIK